MQKTTARSLYAGAAMACVSGLLMGAAMKPTLGVGDRPEGPQMFAGWSGVRATGPFDDGPGFVYAQGQVPDYVVGSDWKRQVAWQDDGDPGYEPPGDEASAYEPPPRPATYVSAFDEPREPVAYPSMSGGARYDVEVATPPERPEATTATFEEDAPPEATGDTTLANG